MPRFVAHVHKELRDQRAILIAVFAALPVLTLLAYWAFADRLVDAPARDVAEVFVPIALALYLLALAGDLFAGDVRRSTVALLRRQPGGLAYAFAAKATLVAVGLAAVLLWQCLVLMAAWWLWGAAFQPGFAMTLEAAFWSPLTAGAVVLAFWILLASTWLHQGGMAVLLAPLLLGAILAPGVVWALGNRGLSRYLLPDPEDGLLWLAAGLSAVALAAAAWSWLGGRGVVRSAWSAAWRGLAVVCVLVTSAYAYAALHVHQALDLTPASEDLRIRRAYVSPDGRRLHVVVTRSSAGRNGEFPSRSWSVDVERGTWHAVGGWDETIEPPPMRALWAWPGSSGSSLEPQPRLVQYRLRGVDGADAVWIDASTGKILKTIPADVRPSDVRRWIEEASRTATWLRDAEGRRVWVEFESGIAQREGEAPPAYTERRPGSPMRAVPGGWAWREWKTHEFVYYEAETGERHVISDLLLGPHLQWFAPGRAVGYRREPGSRKQTRVVVDVLAGEIRPLTGMPEGFRGFVLPLETGAALTVARVDGKGRVVAWDPTRGHVTPFTWEGARTDPVGDVWLLGRDADGNAAVAVQQGVLWTLLVVGPDGSTRVLREGGPRPWCFALMPDGSAFGIERNRRIVRYGPEPGRREVLFPR